MSGLLRHLYFSWIVLVQVTVVAQTDNPYHLNGDAYQETCNCYTLTNDAFNESGSVWNINKISLDEPFDYKFSLYLGCHDGDGADGIAFVLQPISTSIGEVGGGIGYDGVNPSIGVLVDTWQNYEDNDPVYDHIAIHKNGIIDHSPFTDVAEPVTALASGENIEDCKWHTLGVKWDPVTKVISVQMDGVDRVSATIDLVNEIFHGDDLVFWGFTAATGGAKNHQRVCTSLDPKFVFRDDQEFCFPETIHFIDSSTSFGTITKWFWDFGDGTTSESSSPEPHDYSAPGVYNASLRILGNNGCLSDPFTYTVTMGTEPIPNFGYAPQPVCEGMPITFFDSSIVEYGTVDKWNWKIRSQIFDMKDPPPQVLSGTNDVQLWVGTREGCVSTTVSASISAFARPVTQFNAQDICLSEPLLLTCQNLDPSVKINQYHWKFGDGASMTSAAPSYKHRYKEGGEYNVTLTAFSDKGCPSETVSKQIKVHQTFAFAGNDTIIAQGQPLQLYGAGGEFYRWSPSSGLNLDNVADPVAILQQSTRYILTTSTIEGCETSDTINIKVYKGPSFYVPSAFTPNNDGLNDELRFVAVGMKSISIFRVYNRFGQVVYSSPDTSRGWDGTLAGKLQPSGTYVWTISGVDYNGTPHFRKGTVTIVR